MTRVNFPFREGGCPPSIRDSHKDITNPRPNEGATTPHDSDPSHQRKEMGSRLYLVRGRLTQWGRLLSKWKNCDRANSVLCEKGGMVSAFFKKRESRKAGEAVLPRKKIWLNEKRT